jgi:hypothetical protein
VRAAAQVVNGLELGAWCVFDAVLRGSGGPTC